MALAAFRRFSVAASAVALVEEPEDVDPELEELVPELDCVVGAEELLLEPALDDRGRAEEPDELVLGAVAVGGVGVDGVGVGVVVTVSVGSGLTGAGSGFGEAARLVAGKTTATIVIASMPRIARDATFCCFP
ncbi:MAG: hypothetical protein LH654_03060 [Thermoleophilia bacterium]|nr:hypothetical protein [Thermoleophilia bacterium]